MKRSILFVFATLCVTLSAIFAASVAGTDATTETATVSEPQGRPIFIRVERFPRPPYSGATYYIYEREGTIICTKLEVCNKYDDCTVKYEKGEFKEDEDRDTGEPFAKEGPFKIARSKERRHVCLRRFGLIE